MGISTDDKDATALLGRAYLGQGGFRWVGRLLVPVVGAISAGEPFRRGNARRLAVLAGVVLVHGVVAPLLPAAATSSVLHRTGLSELEVFEPDGATFEFLPFMVVVGLLVLAEAFRRGEQLADDVEGLV